MPSHRRVLSGIVASAVGVSILALPSAQAAVPANGIERVNLTPLGAQITGDSFPADLSADGRHVVYTAHAAAWTLDRTTGQRVQQDVGATSGDITWSARMTPSGRHVVLATTRTYGPADTNGASDVYVRDRDSDADGIFDEAGATSLELVSVGPGSTAASGGSAPRISDDGNVVTWHGTFGSTVPRIWLRDRAAGLTEAVSNFALMQDHGLSGDGQFVAWISRQNDEGVTVGHNERELFLKSRGSTTKTPLGDTPGGRDSYPMDPAFSPDGRYLAFTSFENDLLLPDSGFDEDVFVIDRTSGAWQAINVTLAGTAGTGRTESPRFSTDSGFLTFVGGDGNLVAGDTNGHDDAFVRSLGANPITARVAMALDGTQPNSYLFPSAVSDGAAVVLFGGGASNLVAGDTNSRPDVFIRTGLDVGPPPPQHTLTVTSAGTGAGTVTSTPAAISCPPTCSAAFAEGTQVTLTAAPTAPSTFTGFSGDCTGTTCNLTMAADRGATATFAAPPPNEPPVAGDDRYDTTQDVPLVIAAPGVLGNDNDPESGPLAAAVLTTPTNGAVVLAPDGALTYTPASGFSGFDSFTYTATDNVGASDTATVTVGVAPPVPAALVVWSRQGGGLWTGGPGRAPQQLLTGEAIYPSWSPDRSHVAFASDRDGQWDLWLVDADGTNLRKLTDDTAGDLEPAWSPDGSRIAFMSHLDGDAEIYTIAVDGTDRRQLTSNTGTYDSGPAWSPDGTRLAWYSGFDIWTMDAGGTAAAALVTGSGSESDPSWSPDGSSIAYTSNPVGGDPRIRIVDVDGTNDRPVDTGMWSHSPSWSPDGRYLTFTASVGLENEVWVVAPDGSGLANISDEPGNDIHPDWGQPRVSSPGRAPFAGDDRFDTTQGVARTVPAPGVLGNDTDPEGGALTAALTTAPAHGSVVVEPGGGFLYTPDAGFTGLDGFTYTATDPAGSSDTATVTVGVGPTAPTDLVVWSKLGGGLWTGGPGRTPTRLIGGEAWQPSWSPDQSQVVFAANRGDGQWDLWLVGADGSNLRKLTDDAAGDEVPAWSPDGSRIAFTCHDGDAEICSVAPDGSGRQQLTNNGGFDYAPAWSPDGTRLAWRSGLDIWTMDADGSGAAALVATEAGEDDPAWSPDGLTIAYTSDPSDGDPQIRLVDADGGNGRSVDTGGAWSTGPSWSPDGNYLAYTVSAAFATEVWVTALDGTARLNISNAANHDLDSDWGRNPVDPPGLPKSLGVLVSGPTHVVQGDARTYTFTVHNGGPTEAAGVVLQLGAGAPGFTQPVTGTTPSQGGCSSITTCQLGTLPAGATVTVTSTVTAQLGIDFEVRALVSCSCSDPLADDNSASLPVTVTAKVDLTLGWKTSAPTGPGQPIVWTASVQGLSGARVPRLVVEFDIPTGVTVTGVTTQLQGSPPGSCVVLDSIVRCTWLPASGTPRVQISGVPQGGDSYVMVGRIVDCGGCIDTNASNDQVACPPVVVLNTADLSIRKTALGQPPYSVGDVVGWSVRVENAGPDPATTTRVLDTMPTGFSFVSATPSQGTCTLKKTAITCELGTLPVGAAATVLVRLQATTARTGVVNTAQTWCECWEVAGSPSNTAGSDPIRIELAIRPVVVTPCGQFTTVGSCQLGLRVPNPNGTTLPPGGTIIIGPLDPVNGPRLQPDATFPSGITCGDLGTTIRCTLPGVQVGGLGFTLPLVFTGSGGAWVGTVTWTCGCGPGGSVVTTLQPLRPTQACVGGQVLFHSNVSQDEDVYAARLDGSGWINLTNNTVTDEADAVWSPDGRHFVFNRGFAESQNRRLFLADLDAFGCIDRVRKVVGQPNADNYQADWSADGSRLAFVSKVNGQHDIYSIGVDGSGLRRVTSNAADERAPSFREDGQRIAFVRNQGTSARPNWDIFSVRFDGSAVQFLGGAATGYASSGADYSPSYSRGLANDRIIWHSNYAARNWDLWVMNGDGSGKQKLAGATSLDEKNAEWSDNGGKVVYDAGTGTSGIWIMDPSGSGRTRIADTGGIDQAPSIINTVAFPYPCGGLSESGGAGVTSRVTEMGRTSGTFVLDYDTYVVPDRIDVIYQGAVIWTTGGPVAANTSVAIPYSGTSTRVTVRVTGETQGTVWRYRVHCPT